MWLHTVSVRFQKLSYSFDSNNAPESLSVTVFTRRFHNVFPQVTRCGLAPLPAPPLPFQPLLSVDYKASNTPDVRVLRSQNSPPQES